MVPTTKKWRKNSLFNKCGENWISSCRKLKLDPYLSPCTSINSKWTNNLNLRPETFKLVYQRTGHTLKLIGIGNNFLNRTTHKQQQMLAGMWRKGTLIHC
jgi:hypothetical protein